MDEFKEIFGPRKGTIIYILDRVIVITVIAAAIVLGALAAITVLVLLAYFLFADYENVWWVRFIFIIFVVAVFKFLVEEAKEDYKAQARKQENPNGDFK